MSILAIECSVAHASLALHGSTAMQSNWTALRNHDAFLFPALQEALRALKGDPLEFILVGAGPGSYGGVRVALAAAEGLALVRGARVVALCSWEPISAATGCSVLSDAKRGGWALRTPDGELHVLSTQEVLDRIREGEDIRSIESVETLAKADIHLRYAGLVPSAQALIDYWLGLPIAERQKLALLPAQPIYVRPPHITNSTHRPWEIRK